MIVGLFLNCRPAILLVYIAEKFQFFPSKNEILVKKDANFFEKKTVYMTSVDSNFNFLCGRPHGAGPPLPGPPEPDPLSLRADVINGWPLTPLTSELGRLTLLLRVRDYKRYIFSKFF